MIVLTLLLATPAPAECIALNAPCLRSCAAPFTSTRTGAPQIINGCLWPDVRALTQVLGIGQGRLGDIETQGLACIGREVPAGAREVIRGRAVVLDGDTFEVADERVRLVAIDAPEPILPARWSRLA